MSEPHTHTNGEIEIYIVIQGVGKVAVGSEIRSIQKGDTVVIPPDTIHITKPDKDLVLAVINTPPFNPDNYKTLGDEESAKAKLLLTRT
jgi:mannose-6-phosphate isomerase-like protein (cupin superfamily)